MSESWVSVLREIIYGIEEWDRQSGGSLRLCPELRGALDKARKALNAPSPQAETAGEYRYCVHCNQWADGPIACCENYDGKTYNAPSPQTGTAPWVEQDDIPNIKAMSVFHKDIGLPLVTRLPNGKWYLHPPLPEISPHPAGETGELNAAGQATYPAKSGETDGVTAEPVPAAPMEPPARKLTPELISAMQKHLLNVHELHPLTHGNIRALCEAAAALASREEAIKRLEHELFDALWQCNAEAKRREELERDIASREEEIKKLREELDPVVPPLNGIPPDRRVSYFVQRFACAVETRGQISNHSNVTDHQRERQQNDVNKSRAQLEAVIRELYRRAEHAEQERDATQRELAESQRRLSEVLEITEDRQDINNAGGPNDWMKIAQIAKGKDRP